MHGGLSYGAMEACNANTASFRDLLSSALADVLQKTPGPEGNQGNAATAADLQMEGPVNGESATEHQHGASDTPDPYAARLEQIKQQYAAEAAAAEEAKQLLQTALQKAQQKDLELLSAADEAYTPAWRTAGLPAKASQLSMDPCWLSGSQLLDPAAIMARHRAQQQKEVVQPPAMFEYCNKEGDPHYLQETGNLKVRQSITRQCISASRPVHAKANQQIAQQPAAAAAGAVPSSKTSSSSTTGRRSGNPPAGISSISNASDKLKVGSKSVPWSQLPAEEVSQKMAAAAARYKALGAVMTPEQMEMEEQIIKNMFQRLSFLRNPRYPSPQSATAALMQNSLTGSKKGHKHKQQHHSSPNKGKSLDPNSAANSATGVYLQSPTEAGFSMTPGAGILFDSYESGGVYFQTVQLQNVSNVMKGLRLLPPASRFFQISLPRFPSAANELAPGISTELSVCFTPDSLGDYQDSFIVETLTGRFEVPLRASRPHPVLTLPEVLQVGDVLVGNSRSRVIEFTNNGGDGRFMLLPAHEWAAAAEQHKQHEQRQQQAAESASQLRPPTSSVAQGPDAFNKTATVAVSDSTMQAGTAAECGALSISPTYLDLPAGSAGKLTVKFTPEASGPYQGDFVLVCDNCTVQQFSVQGNGTEVNCQLVHLDGRDLHDGEEEAPVWFGQVHPGCCCSRTIKVRNTTQLQFPFRWQVDQQQQQQQNGIPQQQPEQHAFAVYPSTGIIQPGGEVNFVINYAPPNVAAHAAAAVLLVERSGDALLKTINTGIVTSSRGTSKAPNASLQTAGQATQATHASQEDKGGDSQQQQGQQQLEEESGWDAVVQLGLEGRGVSIVLRADPAGAVVSLPGQITVGAVGEQQIVLHNDTPAPADIEVSTEEGSQQTSSSSSEKSNRQSASQTVAAVIVDPHTATIPPHSSVQLSVKFLALAAGVHTGNLIVNVRHGQAFRLATRASVQEACVVPAVSQMDFGILSIGHRSVQQLELMNSAGKCKADWAIEQLEIEPTCPRMLLHCEPNSGTLDPSATCSTAVTVTGSCEGTHRLLLRVSSSSSIGGHCTQQRQQQLTQQQYVEVLVTVGVPRVVLDTYRLHLSPAYLGVQQQRAVTLSNVSRLPLQFCWTVQRMYLQQHSSSSRPSLQGGEACHNQVTQQQRAGELGLSIIPAKGQLAPGEQLQLQLLLDPLAVGPVQLLCSCNVPGMTSLAGMVITALIEGLQVAYAVERPLQPSLGAAISSMTASSRHLQQQQQVIHAASQVQGQESVLLADFGVVSLHEVGELLLRVTNQTSMNTTVKAWVSRCPAIAAGSRDGLRSPVQQATGLLKASSAAVTAGSRITSSTLPSTAAPAVLAAAGSGATAVRAVHSSSVSQQALSSKQQQQQHRRTGSPTLSIREQQQYGRTGSPSQQQQQSGLASRLAQTVSGIGISGAISPATGQLQGPFRAAAGNTMMAARLVAAAAAAALDGGCAGCAVAVEPQSAELQGWGEVEMRLIAYNNLPGTYMDILNVQVGDLPIRSIPLRLQVTGSPLVLSKERVLVQGLQQLQHLQQQQPLSPPSPSPPPAATAASSSADGAHHLRANNTATAVDAAAAVADRASIGTVGTGTGLKLALGVVPAGVQYERTFYVVNTGALAMQLTWQCQAPVAAAAAAVSDSFSAVSGTEQLISEPQPPQPAAAAAEAEAEQQEEADEGRPSDTAGGEVKSTSGSSKAARGGSASKASALTSKRPVSAATATKDPVAAAAAAASKAKALATASAEATAARRVSSAASAASAIGAAAGESGTASDQHPAPAEPQQEDVASTIAEQSSSEEIHTSRADPQHSLSSLLPEGGPSSLLKAFQGMAEQRQQQQREDTVPQYSDAFTVEPLDCIVPPRQQQKFTVKFASEDCRVHTMNLVGRQVFVQQGDADGGSASLSLSLWPKDGVAAGPLEVVVAGGFHANAAPPLLPIPNLTVNLSATAVAAQLTPDDPDCLNWTVWSTQDPASHASYKHTVTLCNTAGCPLVFQLGTEGPFELVAAVPSVVQDPDAYRGLKGADAFSTTVGGSNSSSFRLPGNVLLLPPGESVDATLLLKTPAAAMEAAAVLHGAIGSEAAGLDAAEVTAAVEQSKVMLSGALVVTAANGQQQRLDLSAVVLHPVITASLTTLSFGSMHPAAPRPLQLLLTNPTTVDAKWHVKLVPMQQQQQGQQGPLQQQHSAATEVGKLFTVQPDKGVLAGRGLGMPKTQQVTVTFAPSGDVTAAAELRILVDGGSGCIVRLQGQGTFEETKEHLAVLKDL